MGTEKTVVVVGGGIAGISCLEALRHEHDPSNPLYNRLVLISDSRLIKRVTNYETSGRQLERFDVIEEDINEFVSINGSKESDGLQMGSIVGSVRQVDSENKIVFYDIKNDDNTRSDSTTTTTKSLPYDKLCICIGSKPRHLGYSKQGQCPEIDQRVIVIRDTSTVTELRQKLSSCRRLVIVGNGGIGLELVCKVSNCDKIWIVRDQSIGSTFFDPGAAKFLLDSATQNNRFEPIRGNNRISHRASTTSGADSGGDKHQQEPSFGPSLGPNWTQNIELIGQGLSSNNLDIIYRDEVEDVLYLSDQEFPLRIVTREKREIDCDLVATAIGVRPNKLELTRGPSSCQLDMYCDDRGILIDNQMRTSIDHIYAAGDVVSCERWPPNQLWFQMRLWTQARQMGHYAGRCIAAHLRSDDPSIYFTFDCFTHCTSFFGYKLVLLGRYNGQQLPSEEDSSRNDELRPDYEIIARVNPGKDYVKLLVGDDGRIIGSVLVGDSGLEETIENLIHDRIDVSAYKEQLLDDTIDIEDYFD